MGRDPTFSAHISAFDGGKMGDQVNRDKVAGVVAPTKQLLYSSHKYLAPWWRQCKRKLFLISLYFCQFIWYYTWKEPDLHLCTGWAISTSCSSSRRKRTKRKLRLKARGHQSTRKLSWLEPKKKVIFFSFSVCSFFQGKGPNFAAKLWAC